jgi:hypothetical protein
MFLNQSNIPHILWKPKFYCGVHHSPPFLPILNYISRTPCPHPLSWRSILILSSHLHAGLILGLCSVASVLTPYVPHLILFVFTMRKGNGEDYKPWRTSLCSLPQSPVTSSLLRPAIFSSTLSSNSRNLRLSVRVRDQVVRPNVTTKIHVRVVLYVLVITFLDSKLEHKRF